MRPGHGTVPSSDLVESSPSDAELLKGVGDGQLAPLGVLYDRHQKEVRAFVARATNDGPDAEDIAHETFLKLIDVANRFDGRASARPLLLGIAAQLVHRRRRSMSRWARIYGDFGNRVMKAWDLTPEVSSGDREELRRFERALSELSEDKRLTFLLVEFGGLSGEEAAFALSMPVNTIWTRLHYARSELRRVFSREGSR